MKKFIKANAHGRFSKQSYFNQKYIHCGCCHCCVFPWQSFKTQSTLYKMHCTLFGEDNGTQGKTVPLTVWAQECRIVESVSNSFVWYGGLFLPLYNYNGLEAPGLSLYNSGFIFTRYVLCSGCVHCSSSVHHVPGKKSTVPIYMVLVRPGRAELSIYQCRSGRTYH